MKNRTATNSDSLYRPAEHFRRCRSRKRREPKGLQLAAAPLVKSPSMPVQTRRQRCSLSSEHEFLERSRGKTAPPPMSDRATSMNRRWGPISGYSNRQRDNQAGRSESCSVALSRFEIRLLLGIPKSLSRWPQRSALLERTECSYSFMHFGGLRLRIPCHQRSSDHDYAKFRRPQSVAWLNRCLETSATCFDCCLSQEILDGGN